MALMVASGLPGCRAVVTASLSRSAAERSAAVNSVIVHDTSVAVSMARSAMPGWGIGCGFSLFNVRCSQNYGLIAGRPIEAVTFGYPRVRCFEQRVFWDLGYPRQAPL